MRHSHLNASVTSAMEGYAEVCPGTSQALDDGFANAFGSAGYERVLATEFFWRQPPTPEAREIFLGQVCPGMQVDTLEEWVRLYEGAGLSNTQVVSGPFEMMTPAGFLTDEGVANCLAIMGHAMTRLSYLRKMAWLMPRLQRAVPYLGYILVVGEKPASAQG